jgi:hypothetical protein
MATYACIRRLNAEKSTELEIDKKEVDGDGMTALRARLLSSGSSMAFGG